ncbi:MAG: hypothetical protein PHR68_04345, partial [Candidatus Gracilibacteria bacterium]|nr:hypothetical protein [Candidatus Gracilibacteria bacterium]
MEESLFTCEDCYQIIDDYKNANVIYKINQNGVLRGPKIIHRDIHERKNTDYEWFRLDEINNKIFHIFIEYDIYKNNQSKIPLNFSDNWLNFVSEINNKYYQTNGKSKIYVSYKKVKNISEDEKNSYFLSQLIELIDKIDEKYRIDIDNSIIYDGINLVNGGKKI